jgi:hypothetical protein
MNYLIALPNDAKAVGYKETRPYQFDQVFSSESMGFTGTEKEFLNAGLAYAYFQGDQFSRYMVKA